MQSYNYSIDSSKITVFNSTFRNNRATYCYSSICVGAILRIYHSSIHVYDSRFEHNQILLLLLEVS